MSTFTGGELEFLAGLNKSWWTLYWTELERLCGHEDIASNTKMEVQTRSKGSTVKSGQTAKK